MLMGLRKLLRADLTGLKPGRPKNSVGIWPWNLNRLYPEILKCSSHGRVIYGKPGPPGTIQRLSQVAPDSSGKKYGGGREAYESQGSYTEARGRYHRVLTARCQTGKGHPLSIGAEPLFAQIGDRSNSAELSRSTEGVPAGATIAILVMPAPRTSSRESISQRPGRPRRETDARKDTLEQALNLYPDFEEHTWD